MNCSCYGFLSLNIDSVLDAFASNNIDKPKKKWKRKPQISLTTRSGLRGLQGKAARPKCSICILRPLSRDTLNAEVQMVTQYNRTNLTKGVHILTFSF